MPVEYKSFSLASWCPNNYLCSLSTLPSLPALPHRLRGMSEGEISCGLLTEEESISLLLKSADLQELIDNPPPAAYEAVECCGRLALALPIAAGMLNI